MDQANRLPAAADDGPFTPWQRLMRSPAFLAELDRLYDARFLVELEMLVGPRADIDELRKGVCIAARAYVKERRRMRHRKPGKLEHRNLLGLSAKLEGVVAALARVEKSPNCSGKLSEALKELSTTADPSAVGIASAMDTALGPGDPVHHIAKFLNLLQQAVAQTVALDEVGTPESYYEADLDCWYARPKTTESQPIAALARAFRPYWDRYALRPFTAGRYDKTTGQNKAPAVDAIHLIGRKLDPELPRARVVTALREL